MSVHFKTFVSGFLDLLTPDFKNLAFNIFNHILILSLFKEVLYLHKIILFQSYPLFPRVTY